MRNIHDVKFFFHLKKTFTNDGQTITIAHLEPLARASLKG